MDIEKRKKAYIAYVNTLAYAEAYFRDDWDCYYFSLGGKCFGWVGDDLVTVKGNPQDNQAMKETYKDVISGYHMNKIHWISIYLHTTELTDQDIMEMIKISYELVWGKMTKKERETLMKDGENNEV